jgi:hypothetical protein
MKSVHLSSHPPLQWGLVATVLALAALAGCEQRQPRRPGRRRSRPAPSSTIP